MKIKKLASLVVVAVLTLSACSSNESILPVEESENALKSYKIKRDATGAYSIDLDVDENVKTQAFKNEETNKNEFHFYESDNQASKKQSKELLIDDQELSIGFVDTRSNKTSNISIIDDNIEMAKKNLDDTFLSEYSITSNEDGTYDLDFTVKNQTTVDFIYNEETSIYEIHLEKGKSSETIYSRNFTKLEGEVLRIDFVNHFVNILESKSSQESMRVSRTPRVLVDM
ncbi:hypothetical protein BXQ17_07610 [Polaribacter sp. BM10]|uniref:hypothetical protein n=1 Tax=Polaribacter sp. BM10 TaxID=1529069 RepID=UPI00098A60EA|nr:hypothetical protein [Polaribacter sp. BM10]AQS93932.1 hypothetical protein BXQ17_07610 [Polaribacter sp. BM10]